MLRAIQVAYVFLYIFSSTGSAFGGFLIEMHNGGEIFVGDYWKAEGEIRFSRYGGLIGIPEIEVKDIRPAESFVDPGVPSARIAGFSPAVAKTPGKSDQLTRTVESKRETLGDAPAEPGNAGDKLSPEEFKRRSDELRHALGANIREARNEVRNIENSRRIGDEGTEQAAMARLRVLVEEQGRLTSETELLYEGSLPPWWFNIMEGR